MSLSRHEMNKGWLVFIESNTSGTGRLFTSKASAYGYRPAMLAETPGRYSYLEQDGIHCVKCDTSSMAALQQSVEALAREAPVSGVFSSSEYFIEAAAALARARNLPGADPQSVRACRDKSRQRSSLKAAGFDAPRFKIVTSAPAAVAALDEISLPVVVKPTKGSGSVGVKLCRTPAEVSEHAARLLQRTVNERGLPAPSELLIEQYLVGDEFSVETLNGEIVGVTRKHISPEPFFVETGHDFPAELPGEVEDRMAAAVRTALQSLGLSWGPAHIELRLTMAGLAIVEINPRLAGGFIPEIVRLASGVDLIHETLKLVVGAIPDVRHVKNEHASIRFITPGDEGIIRRFVGFEQALEIEGIRDIQAYRKVGDSVRIEHDFRDRIGHVIACGRSEAVAAMAAETARTKIGIEIDSRWRESS